MANKRNRQFGIRGSFRTFLVMVAVLVMVSAFDTSVASAQLNLDRLLGGSKKSSPDKDANGAKKPSSSKGGLSTLGQGVASGSDSTDADPRAQLMFGSAPFDLQTLQPLFETPELEADTQSGPVLQHEAEKTLQAGDQTTAMQLMFGHMAAEYESARPTLLKVKFSKLLRRPVWNLRFGVSMSVRDAGIDDEDPNPIPADASALTGRARRTDPTRSDRPAQARNSERNRLEELLGRNGINRRDRRTPNRPRVPSSDSRTEQRRAGGVADSPGIKQNNTVPGKPEPTYIEMLGLVAQVVGEEFSVRYNRGDFGPMLVDLSNTSTDPPAADPIKGSAPAAAPTPAAGLRSLGRSGLTPFGGARRPQQAAPPHAAAAADTTTTQVLTSANALPIWRPGIVSLGNGPSKEMIEKAGKAKLDLLIHFDVILKTRSGSPVQNISRCRLINVATKKSIGLSKVMDSSEEAKLDGDLGGREYVNARLENLMAILDRDVKVVELPKLTPEAARRRLGMLLGSSQQRSLQTLAEIRLYEMRQLLTRDEVEAAFDMVGGTDSLLFLYGSPEERASMARMWAAESTKQNSDS